MFTTKLASSRKTTKKRGRKTLLASKLHDETKPGSIQ